MSVTISRPEIILSPGDGLLRNDFFQIAYATNDIDRACNLFGDRFGIKAFRRLEGQLPAGGHIRIELAWAGGTMYELVTAHGPGSELFTAQLPPSGFALRHHHLGFFIRDDSAWQALATECAERGWVVRSKSDNKGFLKACMVEVPELGHFLEYIYPEPAGAAFFEGVPRS
jgi:hypothetical protein